MKDFNKQTRLTKSNVIPEICSRGSVVYKTNRFPTETLGNDASVGAGLLTKGFTLIELLVVVLIIGILSAVALPQYTKAVEKSRATQGWALASALKKNLEMCHLSGASAGGADFWDCSDMDLPADSQTLVNCKAFTVTNVCRQYKDWIYGVAMGGAVGASRMKGDTRMYTLWYSADDGRRCCFPGTGAYANACRDLGAKGSGLCWTFD